MIKIACIGDNCIDYYDQTGNAYPGGNPVNVSVYIKRNGYDASYLGAVGTDSYGKVITEGLASKGVDISHVKVLEGATALSHVSIIDGDRVFGDYDEGVMTEFVLDKEDYYFLGSHDLVLSGLYGHVENSLQRIKSMGVPIAFDCSERPEDEVCKIALKSTDIAFFSDSDSDDDNLKDRMISVAQQGPSIVVATRGSKGSICWDGESFIEFGILPCDLVDTMGAGDSFIAGFLTAWLENRTIKQCMEAGAKTSAVTIGYSGAW